MGTNYLAPTWRQPENNNKDRLSNYSIDYDGSSDYITVDDNIFSGLETWSMAGFYNLSRLDDDSAIFGKYANSPQQILLYWDNPLGWRLLWAGDSSNGQLVQLPSISADEWHFIAITYDGTTVKMYLDDQVYTNTASTGAIVTDTGAWQIGADGNAGKEFNGKLSQLSFYDYAVGATEIAYLRNGGNPLVISGAEPIAYYPLGDNSNPTATAGYPNIISDSDAVFDFTSNGYITLATVPELGMAGASNYTTNIWINRDSNTQEGILGYNYANPNGSGWYLWANGTTLTAQLGYDGGTAAPYGTWKYTIPSADFIGSWHMITMVFDGSQTGQDRLKVYYDGVEPSGGFYADANLFPSVLPNGVSSDQNRNVYLGVLQTGTNPAAGLTGYLFNGQMSNAEFWKDSLTSAEVLTLYNNGQPLDGGQPEADKLRAWYKLNQSAVLTPGNPTNWTITKIGSPNYSGSSDGCFNVTVAGALEWHDNNYNQLSDGNYFQWNSPTIYTSGSDIVLSSTGGSHFNPYNANEISLEYSIDGGSFVVWHTQVIPTSFGAAFTIPSTGNLTVSNNIRIIVKGVDQGSTGAGRSYLRLLDVSATGGTTNYTESFGGTQYGWYGGAENQPPATFSADKWDIPDNRSAYPQSFDFDSQDYIEVPQINTTGAISISGWVKTTDANYNMIYNEDEALRSGGNRNLFFSTVGSVLRLNLRFDTGTSVTVNTSGITLNDGNWHHVAGVWNGTTDSNEIKLFVDGVLRGQGTATETTRKNFTMLGNIGGSNATYDMNGQLSNIQTYTTGLTYGSVSSLGDTAGGQVAQLYNNGVPLPTASVEPSNLKLWTRLDSSSKWNTITSQWNIPINPTTPIPWSKSALSKSVFNTYIENPSTSGIDLTNPTTSSFWFKSKTTLTNFAINAGSLGGGNDLAVIGERILVYRGSNNYRYFDVYTTIINDNNWHNLILYTPGYANADIASTRLFMDGIELNVNTTISSGSPGTTSNNPILGVGNVYADIDEASFSNAVIWSSDQTANVAEIYNNGTPASSYTDSPILWWELNNLTSGLDDLSGNGNNAIPSGPVFTVVEEDIIAYQLGVSEDMTEANLIEENVSVANGESDTLPASALVQSDITRKLPFSSYSTQFDGLNHFGDSPFSAFELQTISYSVWFKRTGSLTGSVCLITQGSSSNQGWTCWLDNTTIRGQFGANNNNSYNNSIVTSYKTYIPDNTWGNITATCNGTDQKIYVNGILRNTYTDVATIDYGSVVGFRIGERVTGSSNFYGEISNPAVWNQALTDDDVLNIYNNGVPQDLSNFSIAPLAWWELGGKYTYWNGTDLVARSTSTGDFDVTGTNTSQSQIVGTAPGSEANGVGSNLTIADLKGDMQNSTNNSYSINMADYADGITNPADSGRSTNVP